jgi:hypothetical protein
LRPVRVDHHAREPDGLLEHACDLLEQRRDGVVADHEVGHVHQPLQAADRDEVFDGHGR